VTDLQLDYGMEYLRNHYEKSPTFCDAMIDCPAFWTWWIEELWHRRDMALCEGISQQHPGAPWYWEGRPIYTPWTFYTSLHDPFAIVHTPDKQLVRAALDYFPFKAVTV
jgi:hypothetical protein